MRAGERTNSGQRCSGGVHSHLLGTRGGAAFEYRRTADSFRRRSEGGYRAGVFLPLQPDATRFARSAHAEHGHRAQYHRGDDADGATAEAIAGAGGRAAEPAEGADRGQPPPGGTGSHAAEIRRTAQAPAGGAAREGGAARGYFEVQIRVPREHVARAANAAQQPFDSGADAGGKLRPSAYAEAGEVRGDD